MLFAGLVLRTTSMQVAAQVGDHWTERSQILQSEWRQSLGGSLTLGPEECEANDTLMKYKTAEWEQGFQRPGEYPPNMHFFQGKLAMENSTIFKILKQMPKGVLLHTHDFGMLSFEGLLKLTYTDDLYVCDEPQLGLKFRFFKTPDNSSCLQGWQLLADLRRLSEKDINAHIRKELSLVVDDPHSTYPTIDAVWSKFQSIYVKVAPIVTYKPVFDKYFYRALKELHDDQVWYVQVRTTLPDLYDLMGRQYRGGQVVKAYKEITEKFKRAHPKFIGAKLIYAPPRHVTNETMAGYVATFTNIKAAFNDFVLGFDLVGQEDKGAPLKDFLPHLLPMKETCDFFFHAGETDWFGSTTDENLVDAILLGTKRIGHGYALLKHPVLMQRVRDEAIVLEVSPISNQVLKLVEDIRNHPGAVFGATAMPMVVTNDDPTYWDAKGVSYDWYMAFMGMANRHSDLRYLKMLALNSIYHSGLRSGEITQLMVQWLPEWAEFVRKLSNDAIN